MMKEESPQKISPLPGNAIRFSPSFLCRDQYRSQAKTKNKPTINKESLMNTNTESKHAVEQANARFPKLIASSAAATLGMVLVAVGLLIAVPRANAATTVSTADKDFILAAAQGGMTEVKLGELAAQKGMRDDVKAFGQ